MKAMTNLNKIVTELLEAEKAVQASSCSCGLPSLMSQLAQLTQRQQSLNMMMQSFIPFSMGSSGMQEQLAQLMQEQGAISDALKQVADGLKGKTLGDLGGAAQEMDKIAKDLEKGITQEIIERQNRVLQHLLDAQKSIYTKKYSRQRISEPGEDFLSLPSPLPPELSTKYGISQKDIIEALKKDYPKEYERLIKAYFRSISK
jgi:nitrogen-specific signal transduction histidine kinase